jgi:hypothetical protein
MQYCPWGTELNTRCLSYQLSEHYNDACLAVSLQQLQVTCNCHALMFSFDSCMSTCQLLKVFDFIAVDIGLTVRNIAVYMQDSQCEISQYACRTHSVAVYTCRTHSVAVYTCRTHSVAVCMQDSQCGSIYMQDSQCGSMHAGRAIRSSPTSTFFVSFRYVLCHCVCFSSFDSKFQLFARLGQVGRLLQIFFVRGTHNNSSMTDSVILRRVHAIELSPAFGWSCGGWHQVTLFRNWYRVQKNIQLHQTLNR